MHKRFGDIKANATRADDSYAFANLSFAAQHVYIREHVWHVLTWDANIAWHNACGDNHFVKLSKHICARLGI